MRTMRVIAWAALLAATAVIAEDGHMHGDHQAAPGAPAAQQGMEDLQMVASKTVKGEIVDITCYIRHQVRGDEHAQCAARCADMGMPLGVLEDGTEQIYLIIPSGHSDPRQGVLEHIGKHVEVKGTALALGGVATLEINEVREL